jgi:uncharacterized damage-inducible protein DinB
MSDELATVVIEALRVRITGVFPAQIRESLDQLSDEQIWSRPNEQSNSVGNLVLHLTGSLNHYLNHKLGTLDFRRDRPAEFAERGPVSRDELRTRFDEMVRRAEETFSSITAGQLMKPSPEPKMNRYVVEDLLNIAVHMSTHAGQILWITKMFRGGAFNDLWMKTHRSTGAWRG